MYVIHSDRTRRFYIGLTEDVKHRVDQHNDGVSTWSRKFGPWSLIHAEPFADYSQARKREIQLKKQKGGCGFYKLLGRTREELLNGERAPGS